MLLLLLFAGRVVDGMAAWRAAERVATTHFVPQQACVIERCGVLTEAEVAEHKAQVAAAEAARKAPKKKKAGKMSKAEKKAAKKAKKAKAAADKAKE